MKTEHEAIFVKVGQGSDVWINAASKTITDAHLQAEFLRNLEQCAAKSHHVDSLAVLAFSFRDRGITETRD